ncbi:MAG: multiubiquitin domain-containing protein [Thermoguttaceae bacterium]
MQDNDNGSSDSHDGNDHGGGDDNSGPDHSVTIKIDRETFQVRQEEMTGQALRLLPKPPIGPDRDLFEVVPGGSDKKIENETVVKLKDGMRFFTAPAQINPGAKG